MKTAHAATHRDRSAPSTTNHWYGLELSPLQAALLALAMAVGMVGYIYPLSFLAGHSSFFDQGDAAHHVNGWLAYVADGWRFPLMRTLALNPPDGINIIFTDSIPLLALLLKLFKPWLPDGFHYFGWWHVVVYVSQALASVFLLRALGIKHLAGTVAGVGFALMSPVLTNRVAHVALATHAFILLAIAVCWLGATGQWRSQKVHRWATGLAVLSMLIHAYLFGMVMLFLCLSLVQFWRNGESARLQWQRMGRTLALIAIIGWIFGFFDNRLGGGGYGHFSMNLLAPFCSSGLLHTCSFDATGGQYEGFNYLGLGALGLISSSLLLFRGGWRTVVSEHTGFFVLLLLLTLFATSNVVYLGNLQLVSIPIPGELMKPLHVFRASGRFFWPVGYALLFLSLMLWLRVPTPSKTMVVVLALAVQWLDTNGMREATKSYVHQPPGEIAPAWRQNLEGIDKLAVYPPYLCPSYPEQENTLALIQRTALLDKVTMNTVFSARTRVNCTDLSAQFSEDFETKTLYMVPREWTQKTALPTGFTNAMARGQCAVQREALVCRVDYDSRRWRSLAQSQRPQLLASWPAPTTVNPGFDPQLPHLGLAQPLSTPVFQSGWSDPEPWGRWSDGDAAVLVFDTTTQRPDTAYRLHIEGGAYLPDQRLNMRIDLSANGHPLPAISFMAGGVVTRAAVDIPAGTVKPGQRLTITLKPDRPSSPCKQQASPDCRLLGLGVHTIHLYAL